MQNIVIASDEMKSLANKSSKSAIGIAPENTINAGRLMLDLDFDPINRIIYLPEEINLRTAQYVLERINYINLLSRDSTSPITLEIACYGGDVYGMFGTVDLMESVSTPIHTFAVGTAMSAASLILAAGEKGYRKITKNTIVMIHPVATMLNGGAPMDMEIETKQAKLLQNRLTELLGKFTNKSEKYWQSTVKKNIYLTADDCLAFGIVDKII